MTTFDDLPIDVRRERFGWFGKPWWSYVCYDEAGKLIEGMRKSFPAGESCLYCGEPFSEAAGDSGQAVPAVTTEGTSICHVHKECMFRQVAGGLAHHERRCHCHGGEGGGTPGMTLREEALEVWRRMRAGELFKSRGEDKAMGETGAAARAAGKKVTARVMMTHGPDALLELPGEDLPVRVPAAEAAEGLGVDVLELPGMRVLVTVRETPQDGRVLSEFRPVT